MKKVFLIFILIFCVILFSVSKNSNSYVIENKLYKAESITLKSETGFKIENGYLIGVEPEREVGDFDLGLDSKYTTSFVNKNDVAKTSGYIFTGDKIQVNLKNEIVGNYPVLIRGDVTGDGQISPVDYVKVKNHIMLNGVITDKDYAFAADYNADSKISTMDYVMIKNRIMNRSNVKYTIKYNNNGGSGSISKQEVFENETTNLRRNTFKRDLYNFQGWNTKADGSGTSYKDLSKIKVTKNITLYAQWKAKGVSVTFASFNVGYFACGSSSITCQASSDNIVNLINENHIDVIGMQEARDTNTASSGYCHYTLNKVNRIKKSLNYNDYITCPTNVNAILSKYTLNTKDHTSMSCGETRSLDKVVITINGVDVSFYNTHLGLRDCNVQHWQKIAEIVQNDPNPIVMTADYNYIKIDRFDTYLKPLGFEIAAYDTLEHNMWNKPSYCDMVLINPKGHIDVLSSKTIDAYGTYSDHNLVIAELLIH